MYYLFEYRMRDGARTTYVPYKCIYKIKTTYEYINGYSTQSLIEEMNKKGIVHQYQHYNWRTMYLNIGHRNVIHGGNYERVLELIKKYKRRNSLKKLLN